VRIAAVLFIAAAAFAWVAVHGLLPLGSTGATPPAIVLHAEGGTGSSTADRRRGGRFAVPRKLELAPLNTFQRQRSQGTRP
jgi:hypothetical protein